VRGSKSIKLLCAYDISDKKKPVVTPAQKVTRLVGQTRRQVIKDA